jgi:CheY-like chemotaxis protein
VASLSAAREALHAEGELLRRRLAAADEAEPLQDEVARLRALQEELERQQADATQRHSQAVSLYMLELNQRSEALHQRDLEIQRLQEQLRVVESAVEDGAAQLATLRRERDLYELQVRQLETVRPHAGDESVAADEDLAAATADEADAVADLPAVEAERAAATELRLVETAPAPARAGRRRVAAPDEPRLIVHVEDQAALRDVVRAEVERCSGLKYAAFADCDAEVPGVEPLLAVNLLAADCDPMEAICDARWGLHEPRAFTYLAVGSRGVIAGLTEIIPHPFSPDDCATRLLERPGGTQRLLMVSDKIEVMNEIRAVLNRVRCSTSVALDGRQAYDLVSMVKPDAILIDLTLPRAEGIRLVNRLRGDAKTVGIPIIFALGEALDMARFRAEAARVLADCRFAAQDLGTAMARVLADWQSDQDNLRAAG